VNKSLNKLSIRDKSILLAMILCLLTYVGYHFLWLPVNEKTQEKTQQEMELKAKTYNGEPLKEQVVTLQSQDMKLSETLEQHKLLQGNKSLNKEDFLTFLTDECTKNNTELIKFNDLDTIEEDGTWKVQFDFELRGLLPALNNICQAIDQINIRYSVGGFSLRQNDEREYLARFFDNSTRLEWYKDVAPEPEKNREQEDNHTEVFEMPPKMPIIQSPSEAEYLPSEEIPEPTQEPLPELDDEELDSLAEQMSFPNTGYKVMFLTNRENTNSHSHSSVMLLNITLEFTMYTNPKDFAKSFLDPSEPEV